MPDFLSRLVERTFSLVTVAQPVIGSIFSPDSSVRNAHPMHEANSHGLVHDNEYLSDQDNVNIDSSQKTGIIPKSDDEPTLNREKPFTDHDIESSDKIVDQSRKIDGEPDFNSINLGISTNEFAFSKPDQLPNNQPLKQNDSGTPEYIEKLSLNKVDEQNNRYSCILPVELAQENVSHYKIDSLISESMLFEGQSSGDEQISQNRPSFDKRQLQKPEIVSSRQAEPGFSHSVGLQKNQDINRSLKLEPEFSSNDFFAGNAIHSVEKINLEQDSNSSLMPGNPVSLGRINSIQKSNEPVLDADFYQSGHRHSNALLPINPTIQNLKSVNAQEANETLRQMGNTLKEPHTAASRSTTITPTVKVTIGRIEVRAIKPPQDPLTLAPQQQIPFPSRQQPILSLDEYLKQHNG